MPNAITLIATGAITTSLFIAPFVLSLSACLAYIGMMASAPYFIAKGYAKFTQQ
jgi:hypothetical protein